MRINQQREAALRSVLVSLITHTEIRERVLTFSHNNAFGFKIDFTQFGKINKIYKV